MSAPMDRSPSSVSSPRLHAETPLELGEPDLPSPRQRSGLLWWTLRGLVPAAILAFAGFATLLLLLTKPPPALQEDANRPPLVVTSRLDTMPRQIRIALNGTVLPRREISLAAEVKGKLISQSSDFLAGRFVKAGTELLTIDPRSYQLQIQRLQGQIAQVKQDLENLAIEQTNNQSLIKIAEQNSALAERKVERARRLNDRGSLSNEEYDATQSEALTVANALQQLRNQQNLFASQRKQLEVQKTLAQTQLEIAQLDLDNTVIRMPVDGILRECHVEKDGYVASGTVVAQVQDVSVMEVRCELRMEDLAWLQRGQSPGELTATRSYEVPKTPAEIQYRLAGQTFVWSGRLVRFEGAGLNEQTRTLPCRVEILQPVAEHNPPSVEPPQLLRGMFVDVTLLVNRPQPLLEVPLEALRPGENVWVVRDERIQIVPVQIARYTPNAALVYLGQAQGIRRGDQVVISPLLQATAGMQIRRKSQGTEP